MSSNAFSIILIIFREDIESLNFAHQLGTGGVSHTLPIRVCAAQRGRDFEAPDLERGIHSREVWVEVCRRVRRSQTLCKTKIAHFAIMFKTGDTNE